jgi:hypothetical protein
MAPVKLALDLAVLDPIAPARGATGGSGSIFQRSDARSPAILGRR